MATPDIVVCSLFVNRPVRTRMPWWCGDWGLETPGYPIRPDGISKMAVNAVTSPPPYALV